MGNKATVKIIEIINTEDKEKYENQLKEFKDNQFLVRDYEELSLMDRLLYDNRSLGTWLKDNILPEHIFLNILFLDSLFIPRNLRIIRCFCIMGFMFGFNALIYTDDDIKERNNIDIDPDVISLLIIIEFNIYKVKVFSTKKLYQLYCSSSIKFLIRFNY